MSSLYWKNDGDHITLYNCWQCNGYVVICLKAIQYNTNVMNIIKTVAMSQKFGNCFVTRHSVLTLFSCSVNCPW